MPVDLQSIQSFVGVTNFDRLTISEDNTLGTRSAVAAFFRRIGDAFLSLSQAGRAAIAERNDRILAAMQTAVNEARAHEQPEVRTLGERLKAVKAHLQNAASRCNNAVLADRLNQLRADRGFQRLPEISQRALLDGFRTLAGNLPFADWQRSMDSLKADFLRPAADRLDPAGPERFKTMLTDEFLKPTQQDKVGENGMHESFYLDTRRRSIGAIGGQPVPVILQNPPNGPADAHALMPDEVAAFCEERLRVLVGEDHANLLPFISMMASQAGLDSAESFLPWLLGISDKADFHLTEAGLMPADSTHDMTIDREGGDLIIRSTFHGEFINSNTDNLPGSVLSRDGSVSLRIHLDQAPAAHVVTMPPTETLPEREAVVQIPRFTVENAEVNYSVPNNVAALLA